MKCPRCGKYEGIIDNEYGILPCAICTKSDEAIAKPTQASTYDFSSPLTKVHRKTYGSEMFQPWVDGVLSKEYIEANGGAEGLAGVTKNDIKNAKYTYKGMTRHHKMVADGAVKARKRYGGKAKNDYKVEGI